MIEYKECIIFECLKNTIIFNNSRENIISKVYSCNNRKFSLTFSVCIFEYKKISIKTKGNKYLTLQYYRKVNNLTKRRAHFVDLYII